MPVSHRLRGHGRNAALLVTGALLGSLATCTNTASVSSPDRPTPVGSVSQLFAPSPAFAAQGPSGDVTIADVAESAVPSVVNISITKTVKTRGMGPMMNDPFFREFFGHRLPQTPREHEMRGQGSGVIVSADGVVVTNSHVVDGADEVVVTTHDGRELDAKVVGTDPKTDLAVIKLEGDIGGLEPLRFGTSSNLRLGDVVLAVGNPFGVGQTVTMGIVSATGRNSMGIIDGGYENFIQTDAAINPGNSGGALVNMRGELVGINTAILSRSGGYQGIGFAIPSDMVQPIVDSLVKTGTVTRGYLGVAIQTVDRDLAAALNLSTKRGVLVSDVQDGTPAAKAGFQRGDVIVGLGGKSIDSSAQLRNRIAATPPGTQVAFEVLRKGKKIELRATLEALAADATAKAEIEADEGRLGGTRVAALSDQARERFDIPAEVEHGVVVVDVERGSNADRAGLRPGDVILELNRKAVKSVDDFTRMQKKSEGTIALLVYRNGSTFYLALRR